MTAPSAPLVPDRLATAISEAQCREVAGRNRPFLRRSLSALRKARLKAGDPPITYVLDGTPILLPLSHLLPVHRAANPTYSQNLGQVVAAVAALRPGATLVDIGANVGDSVAIVRARVHLPILCVEGDAVFLPYLRQNVAGAADVEIAACYVATSSDAGRRSVVERSGGTARLVDREDGDLNQVLPLADVLAQRPVFAQPTIVKIDTDGHDASILRTASNILRAHHPVLFFEHDPALAADVGAADPGTLFAELADLGYDTFVLFDNRGPRLEVLRAADVDELEAWTHRLDPDSDQTYLDVCAVHRGDADLAAAIVAAT